MTNKPTYRWETRRAAKSRRQDRVGAISTHDLIMLTIIMTMMVIVLRIIFIFGITQGMELGPFTSDPDSLPNPLPYANLQSANESFHSLKYISAILLIYWTLVSWKSFVSKSVSLSTKIFKGLIGISILTLFAGSFMPENAAQLAAIWFEPPHQPRAKL